MQEIDSVALEIDFVPCRTQNEGHQCVNQTLEELKEFLGSPELVIYHNNQRFLSSVYSEDCIVSESIIWN